APKVILTAGHCVYQGVVKSTTWWITLPFLDGENSFATSSALYDWDDARGDVDPDEHDIGLIFLDAPITLSTYPSLAASPLSIGSRVVNVGRKNDGQLTDELYVSPPLHVGIDGAYPYDYSAADKIETGDSGGPDFALATHSIV